MSNTRTAKKTSAELALAGIQLDAGDQEARLPEDERASVDDEGTIKAPFKGKEFAVTEFSTLALMEWAASDASTSMGAAFRLLKSVVTEKDWPEFAATANRTKAQLEELMAFLNAAMEAVSGRPTEEPGL